MTVSAVRIAGPDDAAAVFRELVKEAAVEGLVVLGLDGHRRPCGVAANPRHRSLSWLKIWELADLVAEFGAHELLIGIFPPGPGRPPSQHEIDVFVGLSERARQAQVVLLDCIVVRGDGWTSLRERSHFVDLDQHVGGRGGSDGHST
jgi:hypothetical protein